MKIVSQSEEYSITWNIFSFVICKVNLLMCFEDLRQLMQTGLMRANYVWLCFLKWDFIFLDVINVTICFWIRFCLNIFCFAWFFHRFVFKPIVVVQGYGLIHVPVELMVNSRDFSFIVFCNDLFCLLYWSFLSSLMTFLSSVLIFFVFCNDLLCLL